ncbi:MAG TPA: hypothetical protein VFQ88_15305 [Nevskiaceae bacterium]|nr:hypothetical protein [Nevskiaceae bacterium]
MNKVVPNAEQLRALRRISVAVVEAVDEAGPLGAPGGVLYAAMMQYGSTLQQFESLMGGLVKNGYLRREGELYFTGPRASAVLASSKAAKRAA